MALCPYCGEEISYHVSDEKVVQLAGWPPLELSCDQYGEEISYHISSGNAAQLVDLPLLELSCDHCKKVICVAPAPEYTTQTFKKLSLFRKQLY